MTVIRFNDQGRPYWQRVKTAEFRTHFFHKECNYSQDDMKWFRKSLATMD